MFFVLYTTPIVVREHLLTEGLRAQARICHDHAKGSANKDTYADINIASTSWRPLTPCKQGGGNHVRNRWYRYGNGKDEPETNEFV